MSTKNLKNDAINLIIAEFAGISFRYGRYARFFNNGFFNDSFKHIASGIKTNLVEDADRIHDLLALYKKHADVKSDDVVEIYNHLVGELKEILKNPDYNELASVNVMNKYHIKSTIDIFIDLVKNINGIYRGINHQITFMRATYGIENSKDERFGKTTAGDMIKAEFCVSDNENLVEKTNEEHLRNIAKKLNSFKSELYNIFSRTFGDKSDFAGLQLAELIIK